MAQLGFLQFANTTEANAVISQIDTCMGFPNGKTTTWQTPFCMQDGYSPTATTESYFITIMDEISECLTPEQTQVMIPTLPDGWVSCGVVNPDISGSTENYVGS